MGVRNFTSVRLIGLAALATVCTVPIMFLTFVLLIGLFTEPGPMRGEEPQWALMTAIYAPIVVTSCVAGAFYDGALPTRLWPHLLLGFLAGVLLDSIWLAVQLTRDQSLGSFAAAGYLIQPLLGASGSTLSGLVRRLRWQDYLDA